jgi:hypothetical protein
MPRNHRGRINATKWETNIPYVCMPCQEEGRTFETNTARDLWIKLHKKNCDVCKNAQFVDNSVCVEMNDGYTEGLSKKQRKILAKKEVRENASSVHHGGIKFSDEGMFNELTSVHKAMMNSKQIMAVRILCKRIKNKEEELFVRCIIDELKSMNCPHIYNMSDVDCESIISTWGGSKGAVPLYRKSTHIENPKYPHHQLLDDEKEKIINQEKKRLANKRKNIKKRAKIKTDLLTANYINMIANY